MVMNIKDACAMTMKANGAAQGSTLFTQEHVPREEG